MGQQYLDADISFFKNESEKPNITVYINELAKDDVSPIWNAKQAYQMGDVAVIVKTQQIKTAEHGAEWRLAVYRYEARVPTKGINPEWDGYGDREWRYMDFFLV